MNQITLLIDSLADRLEKKGFVKEARDLDVISNTIEAYEEQPTYVTTIEQMDPNLRPEDLSDDRKEENYDLTRRGERK